MEKIYLIHAKAQNGKDTCAERIKHYYELKGKKVLIAAALTYVASVLSAVIQILRLVLIYGRRNKD